MLEKKKIPHYQVGYSHERKDSSMLRNVLTCYLINRQRRNTISFSNHANRCDKMKHLLLTGKKLHNKME